MDFTRQVDIIYPEMLDRYPVTLIGAGGIGAATALALAKMGVQHLEIYDDDTVDDINMPNQLHRVSDIGLPKVTAVAFMIKEFSDEIHGVARQKQIRRGDVLDHAGILISAVDSIKARQAIWGATAWEGGISFRWYLDARMGAETFQLYTVKADDIDWYSEMLTDLSDDDVPDEPCTARATIYTGFIAAGHIAHQVKRIAMGQPVPSVLIHDISSNQLLTPGKMI
jgi:molybdopterin/thiamine biosynthesis adenylyltransferase